MTSRSVLITGASSGIGAACALHLDAQGWQVFAGVRRDEDGAALRGQASNRLRPILMDVVDDESVASAAKEIDAALTPGGLTAVVNNAGIALGGPVEYLPLDFWQRQLEVNVIGQLRVTQAVMPLIRKTASGGRIVFMGSVSGRIAAPMMGPYSASKYALEAVAETMRHELLGSGIKVVLIEPGAVKTPIWAKGRTTTDEIEALLPPEALAQYADALATMRRAIGTQETRGVAPLAVAQVVERALTSARPKARYPVGADAKAAAIMTRVAPDSVRDRLIRKVAAG